MAEGGISALIVDLFTGATEHVDMALEGYAQWKIATIACLLSVVTTYLYCYISQVAREGDEGMYPPPPPPKKGYNFKYLNILLVNVVFSHYTPLHPQLSGQITCSLPIIVIIP